MENGLGPDLGKDTLDPTKIRDIGRVIYRASDPVAFGVYVNDMDLRSRLPLEDVLHDMRTYEAAPASHDDRAKRNGIRVA